MRALLLLFAATLAIAGCFRRGSGQEAAIRLTVTNELTQPVNVRVVVGEKETPVGDVGANETKELPVRDLARGVTVTLKAVTADGVRSYTKEGVKLQARYTWTVP